MLPRLIRFYRQRTASIAVLALLLAQAIGLAHGIAHPHSRGGLPAATVAATVAAAVAASGVTWADGLHDDGSVQCRLLDQLSHADALTNTLSLPSAPPAAQTLVVPPRVAPCVRVARAYLARGPPLFLA
jgi:uncharacterized membrane protein